MRLQVQKMFRASKIIRVIPVLIATGTLTAAIYIYAGKYLEKPKKGMFLPPSKVSVCVPAKKDTIKKTTDK